MLLLHAVEFAAPSTPQHAHCSLTATLLALLLALLLLALLLALLRLRDVVLLSPHKGVAAAARHVRAAAVLQSVASQRRARQMMMDA